MTDDPWGLDYKLGGHPDLPEGALAQGSDLAIGSVHKTLTGAVREQRGARPGRHWVPAQRWR